MEHWQRYLVADGARARVQQAIEAGRLSRPTTLTCVDCGKPATEYDHRDHKAPLVVEAVCHRCNLKRGPADGHSREIIIVDCIRCGYRWRPRKSVVKICARCKTPYFNVPRPQRKQAVA